MQHIPTYKYLFYLQSFTFARIVFIFAIMEESKKDRVLETEAAQLEIKNGVMYARYKPGIVVTLEMAKAMVRSRVEFAENISYPAVVFIDGLKSISKEARDYLAEDGTTGLIAGALVMKSVYNTFIGNFFLKLTNPPFPSKIFTDVNAALEWLEQYKPKEHQASLIV